MTKRGLRVLRKLADLVPEASFAVFTQPEMGTEPLFFEETIEWCRQNQAESIVTRQVGSDSWRSSPPDILLCVNWRFVIANEVCRQPLLGTYIFHDSLLPEYRGFSPTVWAIVDGRDHTGVSLFAATKQVDGGDVVDQQRVPIDPDEMIGEVFEKVTSAYLEVLSRNLVPLLEGTARLIPQDESRATIARRRTSEDNRIDWSRSVRQIHNLIRGVTRPYPGAFTSVQGQRMVVWKSRVHDVAPLAKHGPVRGQVLDILPSGNPLVATGEGTIEIFDLEPPHLLSPGQRLGVDL